LKNEYQFPKIPIITPPPIGKDNNNNNKNSKNLKVENKPIHTKSDYKRAEFFFEEGMSLEESKNYPEAIVSFSKSLAFNNKQPLCLLYLGICHDKLKNFNRAIYFFKQAIKAEPQNPRFLICLSETYFKHKYFDKAIDTLYEAHRLENKNTEIPLKLGEIFYELDDTDRSLEWLNKALKIDYTNYKAWRWLGLVYIKTKEYTKAIYAVLNALKHDKKDFELLYIAGLSYYNLNKYDDAISFIMKVLKIHPTHGKSHLLLGQIYYEQKEYEKSLDHFSSRTDIKLTYIAYYNRGLVQKALGQLPAASQSLRNAINLNKKFVPACSELGHIEFNNNNLPNAEEIYLKVIELDAENTDGYYKLGLIADKNNQVTNAIKYFEKAYQLGKRQPTFLYHYINLLELKRKWEKSIQIYRRIQLDAPQNRNANEVIWLRIGRLNELTNQTTHAITIYKKCIKRRKQFVGAYYYLARLYIEEGRVNLGYKLLDEAIRFTSKKPIDLFYKGKICIYREQFSTAITWLDECKSRDPDFGDAFLEFIIINFALGKYSNAIKAYQQFQRTKKSYFRFTLEHIDNLLYLGRSYLLNNKLKDSINIFQTIIRIDEQNVDTWLFLGKSWLQKGHKGNCLSCIKNIENISLHDARGYMLHAQLALVNNDIHLAKNIFSTAIKKQPLYLENYIERARLSFTNLEIKAAIEDLKNVVRLQPGNKTALFEMARIYASQGNLGTSQTYLEECLNSEKDLLRTSVCLDRIKYFLAEVYYRQKEIKKGITLIKDYLQIDPDKHEFQDLRNRFYLAEGKKSKEVVRVINTRLKKDKNDFGALWMSALISYQKKEYKQCIMFLKQATNGNRNPEAHFLLGKCLSHFKDNVLAEKHFQIAAEEFEKDTTSWFSWEIDLKLGIIYSLLRKWEMAEKYLSMVVRKRPNSTEALYRLARSLFENGKIDSAIDYFKKLLKIEPNNKEGLGLLGWSYVQQKDYKSAVSPLHKAIGLAPKNSDFFLGLGIAYKHIDKRKEAKDTLQKCLELSQFHTQAYFYLGQIFHEEKNYRNAIINLDRALNLDPSYAEAHYQIGLVYGDCINVPRSLYHLKQASELGYSKATTFIQRKGFFDTQFK